MKSQTINYQLHGTRGIIGKKSSNLPVVTLMCSKSSFSNTSPFAITGIETAATTSAIPLHLAGSLGLSATCL